MTAVRLGNARYMKCPKCGRFSTFNLTDKGEDKSLETYSDSRANAKFLWILLIPILFVFVIIPVARKFHSPMVIILISIIPAVFILILFLLVARKGIEKVRG